MNRPVGIVRFLGTNCDRDVFQAIENLGVEARWLWFTDLFEPGDFSALVVPGGFSHGDYLRSGALAARAPVMRSVKQAAESGIPVLGICNGFQILCEAGLLPGALVRNVNRRFVDRWVEVRLAQLTRWSNFERGTALRLPVAHGDGRYYAPEDELARLEDNGQIWCTYSGANPNGSLRDIAGVCNQTKNVCGLMPHPERAMHDWMGGVDGRAILGSVLRA